MVRFSRSRRSRRYGRRRGYGRKRQFAGRVRRVVRNSMAEKKRLSLSTLGTPLEVDWTGRRFYLSEIAQGANEGERIGRIVSPHSFTARFALHNQETNDLKQSAWTAYLVQDMQTVGDAHAAVSEITSSTSTIDAPMGLINVHNKGRFKILKR